MPIKTFDIDLDIKNPEYKLVPYIEVVSGDTDTNRLNINLFEDFVPVNASGNTAVISFAKPDGTTVLQNLTIVDAIKAQYYCILSAQTIVVPGRVRAEVSLYEGTKRVTSTRFEFIVRKAFLDEGTPESSNEFSALTEALATVTQYDSRIATVENEVQASAPVGTLELTTSNPVGSINAKVNGELNFEMTAKPLVVNLLGNDGDFEADANADGVADGWTKGATVTAASSTSIGVKFGTKSQRYQLPGGTSLSSASAYLYKTISYVLGHIYYARINYTNVVALSSTGVIGIRTKFASSGNMALKSNPQANESGIISAIRTAVDGDVGFELFAYDPTIASDVYFDGAMLVDLTTMFGTGNEPDLAWCDANLKFVNGIQPMMGLNVKACGKNLVCNGNCEDGMSGWVNASTVCTVENGKFKVSTTGIAKALYQTVKVKPNTNYNINGIFENGTNTISMRIYEKGTVTLIASGLGIFNTGNRTEIDVSLVLNGVGYSYASQIQLEEGSAATAYESYQGSETLINAEFAGIGTYLDKLTYKNGIVKVIRNVKKVSLDGLLAWVYYSDNIGSKIVKLLSGSFIAGVTASAMAAKYDGKIIQQGSTSTADMTSMSADGNYYISVADTDSGFGETYAPSSVEIAACFNGWKMNNGTFGTPYNGTGTKTWTLWNATSNTGSVTTCPTTKATGWTAWATLWYVLATSQEELLDTPIDGLSVYKGKTTIAMQTGIVKERVNMVISNNAASAGFNIVNTAGWSINSPQTYKIRKILGILKNGAKSLDFTINSGTTYSFGYEYATIPIAKYDKNAVYEVLYEVLHENYDSQQVDIYAEYTANLFDSHNELVKAVSNLQADVADVWLSLLPLAEKEMKMAAVTSLTTETTTDLKNKINEILNIW